MNARFLRPLTTIRRVLRVALALLAPAGIAEAADDTALPYRHETNVVFGEVHGTGLLMDIFTPRGRANGRAIVDVVSGAWSSDRGKIRDHTTAQLYSTFCAHGYVVFAARPGSKTRYTAADMDGHVKLAIRWVKEQAAARGVDPDRLGLTGASAGGHLATLAALTPVPGNPAAKNPLERHGTGVKAVGVFFPPTDFLDWKGDGAMAEAGVLGPLLFVGGAQGRTTEEIREGAKAVSPVHRVTRTDVPFLLIHGDADKVVPVLHSERLVKAIQAAGGDARLLVKPGGGHPWMTLPEEVEILATWFDERLGRPNPSTPASNP